MPSKSQLRRRAFAGGATAEAPAADAAPPALQPVSSSVMFQVLLFGFWLAALLSTEELVAWAAAPLPGGDAASATQRVRRYAAPFVQWLESAPFEELAPAA